jgi:hypothetical protein
MVWRIAMAAVIRVVFGYCFLIFMLQGINYTFQAASTPASVEFAMQPASPGIYNLQLKVPGSPLLTLRIYVMP